MMKKLFFLICMALMAVADVAACTSMVVSARASANGRPLLWKHRDTGVERNFVERVDPTDDTLGYIALYNSGDSLLEEAWMGFNTTGFAVMNTASYNLAPDTAVYKDREGAVMALALKRCRTVDDFVALLDSLPKPMGVQANFGVIDACGGAAYFETDDYGYRRFDADDTPEGLIVRTNFSVTGEPDKGYGYIRCENTCTLLADEMAAGKLTPELFTERVSRSFYHSLIGRDFAEGSDRWVIDQDFVPRRSSTASIVIEGVNASDKAAGMVMWTLLGYPPCAVVTPVTYDNLPEKLRPVDNGDSPECLRVLAMKALAFPVRRGSGPAYIDMDYLRPVIDDNRRRSLEIYKEFRQKNGRNK